MDFVAIDVETANPDLASICQIGLASFKDGTMRESWQSLINPEDYFDDMNVSIHGIDERMVKGAPTFPEIVNAIQQRAEGSVVVSHTSFDSLAISRAREKYGLPPIRSEWLDTARVVRRTWTQLSHRGYGLQNTANMLGIEFSHHDAGEDARAAGEILVRSIQETGITLYDWLQRVNLPIDPAQVSSSGTALQGNPEGPLFGEVVVFTGALSMPRTEAARKASEAGCEVSASVRKSTTILVVGDQDVRRLAGFEKSAKHRKAEELIAAGHAIRILMESDFGRLALLSAKE